MVVFELFDVGLGSFFVDLAVFLDQGEQFLFDIDGHILGVAADVKVSTAFEPVPDFFGVVANLVLDVDLLVAVAGPGEINPGENSLLLHGVELIFVEIVRGFVRIAEKEPVATLGLGDLAFFEKRAKRRNTCPRADHDDIFAQISR